jgi:hypothetical protein
MRDMLPEVLTAIESRRWILPSLSEWHLSLVSFRPFEREFFARAIPELIAATHRRFGVVMRIVGGGPGCGEFEVSIEGRTPEEAKDLARELFDTPGFHDQLRQAAIVRLKLRVTPYSQRDLTTGEVFDPYEQAYRSRTIINQENYMGSKYENKGGQVGVMGANARIKNLTQVWNELQAENGEIDFAQLAQEIAAVRLAAKEADADGDHDEERGVLASAEKAAKAGQGDKVLAALASAGKWTLGIAEKIGVGLVVAMIKKTAGF